MRTSPNLQLLSLKSVASMLKWITNLNIGGELMIEKVTINQEICGGQPCVKGTRIPIYIILDLIGNGYTIERIINECYPHLTEDKIKDALEFAIELIKEDTVFMARV